MSGPSAGPARHERDELRCSVGDVVFTPTTIFMPGGSLPMAGSVWIMRHNGGRGTGLRGRTMAGASRFLRLAGPRAHRYVEVEVRSGDRHHVTRIPAQDPHVIPQVGHTVNYARSLAAWRSPDPEPWPWENTPGAQSAE